MRPASAGRLSGRTALVTGSTAGIGAAIARRFAEEGAFVALHGPGDGEAKAAAEAISESGGRAVSVAGDLADAGVPERLASESIALLGRVDILVNNAAVKARGDLGATDAASFDAIVAVNLRAPLLLTRALLPHFRANGGGCVLNIGSVNAYCGEPNLLAYSISKGGLMTLTRNLADALAEERVRVNQLNLGWVLTDSEDELQRAAGFTPGWATRLPASVAPSGSLLTPEQVAHFALDFVDEGAGAVSGAVVELEQYPMIGRNPAKNPAS